MIRYTNKDVLKSLVFALSIAITYGGSTIYFFEGSVVGKACCFCEDLSSKVELSMIETTTQLACKHFSAHFYLGKFLTADSYKSHQ